MYIPAQSQLWQAAQGGPAWPSKHQSYIREKKEEGLNKKVRVNIVAGEKLTEVVDNDAYIISLIVW